MTDISKLLNNQASHAHIRIEMSLEDLIAFSKHVSNESIEQSNTPNELYTKKQVCDLLGRNQSTLHRWDCTGYLKKQRIGGRVYYHRSDVDKLLNK